MLINQAILIFSEQNPKPDGVLVSIASVEQSSTRPEGDTPYDASRATDGDFGTSAASASSDEEPWMKVTLDRMHCVKQVMWYSGGYAPESTYTCNQDGCVCGGNYCGWSFVTVGVEGGATDSGVPELRAPEDDNSDLDCKYGNMVLFTYDESRSYRSVYFGEIEVSAAPMGKIIRMTDALSSFSTEKLLFPRSALSIFKCRPS